MDDLLPQRYPNQDFFVADIMDAAPKDDLAGMEHPMFSLAKQPDRDSRSYKHNGISVEIFPSHLGLPTIWDKDILIYCISQLMAGINLGREPSKTLRITTHDLLVSTNRPIGGTHYGRVKEALTRLRGSQIITDIKTNGEESEGFGFIDRWKAVKRSKDDSTMIAIEVTLSDWLYRAVLGAEVLTINRDYFRLRGGLERRLYELARKHCGNQSRWPIGIELLHKKSGAKSSLKSFRARIKKVVDANVLPDYRMKLDITKDQLIFYNRTGSKAAKAEFDDGMRKLFAPEYPNQKRRRSVSTRRTTSQVSLDLDMPLS